jgi:hypothetical protein
MKSGQLQAAFVLYSDEFRRGPGAEWQKRLSDVNSRFGAITGYTLLDARVVPQRTAAGEVPCVAVRHNVTHTTFPVEEKLLVCPGPSNTQVITGHELTRLDTRKTIAAGATVKEYELFSIGSKPEIATQTDFEVAGKAADEFYRRVSVEDYGAIWDAAHDDLRNAATRDQMISLMRQVYQKLGTCRAPKLIDTDYATKDGDRFVGLIYSHECEHATINERLAWKIVDGKAMLRGYH